MTDSALYTTIQGQPEAIQRVLETQDGAALTAARALIGRRVWLVGIGTSYHAAVVGASMLQEFGLAATAVRSLEFVLYPRPLGPRDTVIVITHTGTTTYTREAYRLARSAGSAVIAITGFASSLGLDEIRLLTTVPEPSATYTASYLAALAALSLIAGHVGELQGRSMAEWRQALASVPAAITEALAHAEAIRAVAQRLAARGRLVLAGAGPNAATAWEGALKVKESSYLVAEGFELETLLHGGLQAVEAGDLAVVLAVAGPALGRVADAVRALTLVGADVVLVADEEAAGAVGVAPGSNLPTFLVVRLPETMSPLVTTVPLQLLAALTAEIRGTNADDFRFGEPRFAAAYAGLTL